MLKLEQRRHLHSFVIVDSGLSPNGPMVEPSLARYQWRVVRTGDLRPHGPPFDTLLAQRFSRRASFFDNGLPCRARHYRPTVAVKTNARLVQSAAH
jgi:hypothetical protein